MPVPAPGLVSQSLKWMLQPDSPLYVKPSVVPGMLGWLLEFWRHCNEEKYAQGREALAQLNRLALRDFDNLAAQGLDFEMHKAGLMYVFAHAGRQRLQHHDSQSAAAAAAQHVPGRRARRLGSL